MSSKFKDKLLAEGPAVSEVRVDEAGAFTTVWEDGRESLPTNTIEQAIVTRHRARAIAFRLFLKRK